MSLWNSNQPQHPNFFQAAWPALLQTVQIVESRHQKIELEKKVGEYSLKSLQTLFLQSARITFFHHQ